MAPNNCKVTRSGNVDFNTVVYPCAMGQRDYATEKQARLAMKLHRKKCEQCSRGTQHFVYNEMGTAPTPYGEDSLANGQRHHHELLQRIQELI